MPVSQKKVGQGRNKTLQAKLSDFTVSSVSREPAGNSEAMDSDEANASLTLQETTPGQNVYKELGPTSVTILTAINDMKTEFFAKFDGILTAIESV